MFRCINCAQAEEVIKMNGQREGDKFKLNLAMTAIVEMTPVNAPEHKVECVKLNKEVFEAIEDTNELKCPKCDEIAAKKEWVDTFADPLKYHDSENLCHCGGELWMDNIPGTSSYGFVCDDCNWVKPNAIVRGD